MPYCLVVADDLTGANATGVLLKKNGFDTLTLLRDAMEQAASLPMHDCLVVPTDSRAIEAEEAYGRVSRTLKLLQTPDIRLYAKRIDSTLRGNLGRETDAFLDLLGPDYTAVCVPCFPSSGRVIIGSHLMVNGVALRNTEVAQDPKCPVHASDALTLFRRQSRYPVAALHLDDIGDGAEALSKKILALREDGNRILLLDSITQEDMQTIAAAIVLAGIPIISVDPGPFTALMAKRLLPSKKTNTTGKVLCAIGSVNGVAARQTRRLLKELPVAAVYMQTARILESPECRKQEIERIIAEMASRCVGADYLAVIGDGIDPAKRLNFAEYAEKTGLSQEDLSELINEAFAEIVLRLLNVDLSIKGIYSTGGDITAAIHRNAGTIALRLVEEVVPLAGYGQVMGGKLNSLYCVSKGGMVGNERAMVTCVTYLKEHFAPSGNGY